jgi:sugar phosphate isomerase/epimerase
VAVDTYHVWWDDRAPAEVARAGRSGRIRTFQLADWTTPLSAGVLNGRGQIGDEAVDMRAWRERVDAAGYRGAIEVEVFNEELWMRDRAEVLRETAERFVECVPLSGCICQVSRAIWATTAEGAGRVPFSLATSCAAFL